MKYLLPVLALCALLASCSKGAHVDTVTIQQPSKLQYRCQYSPSRWQADRTIAMCDTEKECSEICAKFPRDGQ
jgi:hypothetical protein